MRDDDYNLDQGSNSGNCKELSHSRYILNIELLDLLTLDEMCEKERRVRDDLKVLDLSN